MKSDCTIESGCKVVAGEVIFSTRRKIEGVDSRSLEDAVYAFGFGQQCSYVKPFGEGHINETYAVYMPGADGKDTPLYVLQRININVFKNPDQVMANIFGVTEYLRSMIREAGGDLDREALSYIKTKSGENYFEDGTDSHGAACIMYRILCAIRWWRDRNSSISRHSALAIF